MPSPMDEVVITSDGGTPIVIARLAVSVSCGDEESVAMTVKEYGDDPASAGVPVMAPVEAFKVKPGGRGPEDTDQEYGWVPPDAASVAEYASPVSPLGSEEVVIVRGGGEVMVISRFAVAVRAGELESVAVAVNGDDPAPDGVPVIAPVDELRVRPEGRDPEVIDHA
jgi:hypothetical protein